MRTERKAGSISLSELQGDVDCLVAGGGLAGANAAFSLSADADVLLVEPDGPAAGASGAAAGLVNPFMGRKANPTWRLHEALAALQNATLAADAEDCYHQTGVFRPARNEKQAGFFQDVIAEHGDLAEWIDPDSALALFPDVLVPEGGMLIRGGGYVDVSAFIEKLFEGVVARGGQTLTGAKVADWKEHAGGIKVTLQANGESREVVARRLVLSVGQDFAAHPELANLNLRAVKGQTIRVRTDEPSDGLPPLSGHGYVVPQDDPREFIVGATYEHDFPDLQPSTEQNDYLLEKASNMIEKLADADVLEMRAGARVFAPDNHLPVVAPLNDAETAWFFGALGSRGLLTAPLIATKIARWMDEPESIPEELQI